MNIQWNIYIYVYMLDSKDVETWDNQWSMNHRVLVENSESIQFLTTHPKRSLIIYFYKSLIIILL